MKKIACEMCGSTDIIKKDGVFVCEYCGCKYSPEEAIKLIVEVDGITTYKQLLEKGETYLKLEDYPAAEEVFTEFIYKYPGKYIGYQKMLIAMTWNFSESHYKSSSYHSILERMIKVASDEEKESLKPFIEKAEKYGHFRRFKVRRDEIEERRKKNDADISAVENEISNNRNPVAFILLMDLVFIAFALGIPYGILPLIFTTIAICFTVREIKNYRNTGKSLLIRLEAFRSERSDIQKELDEIDRKIADLHLNDDSIALQTPENMV